MADQNDENDNTDELPVAKRGVKDKGHLVTGALGEPISGAIADITDED